MSARFVGVGAAGRLLSRVPPPPDYLLCALGAASLAATTACATALTTYAICRNFRAERLLYEDGDRTQWEVAERPGARHTLQHSFRLHTQSRPPVSETKKTPTGVQISDRMLKESSWLLFQVIPSERQARVQSSVACGDAILEALGHALGHILIRLTRAGGPRTYNIGTQPGVALKPAPSSHAQK